MDGGNHDIMDYNQDLGDGEVINSEQSGVKYPFFHLLDMAKTFVGGNTKFLRTTIIW
jgi:hypothetical protein